MLRVAIGILHIGLLGASAIHAADGKLTPVDKPPTGISDKVASQLQKIGQQAAVDGAPVCTVWLAEGVSSKPGFVPSLSVKYPFATGQLLGVLEVAKASGYTDFRGQEVKPGVYTLRYAQQPVDGNHVGTSELYDFLLAVPAKADVDPAPLKSADELHKKSAAVAGANHPAIFSLLPAEKVDAPALTHQDERDLWIFRGAVTASDGKNMPIKLVISGRSE